MLPTLCGRVFQATEKNRGRKGKGKNGNNRDYFL